MTNQLTEQMFRFVIEAPAAAGQRLDLYVGLHLEPEGITRSRVKGLLDAGLVLVNGEKKKAGYRTRFQDVITAILPPVEPTALLPEEVPFEVLFEDEALVVLSKPPGVVVHPACGHQSGTLVHGLLAHCHDLSGISGVQRPGIVHRLDKDTSGVMVVAKSDAVHQSLTEQFQGRLIEKKYQALIVGRPKTTEGVVSLPIGRHPISRKKMAVREADGRPAKTSWRVLEEFPSFTFVELILETGRTHQIRVHMAALGHPVARDPLYGGIKEGRALPGLERQFLHALRLGFRHPLTGNYVHFEAPLWHDLEDVLAFLRSTQGAAR